MPLLWKSCAKPWGCHSSVVPLLFSEYSSICTQFHVYIFNRYWFFSLHNGLDCCFIYWAGHQGYYRRQNSRELRDLTVGEAGINSVVMHIKYIRRLQCTVSVYSRRIWCGYRGEGRERGRDFPTFQRRWHLNSKLARWVWVSQAKMERKHILGKEGKASGKEPAVEKLN